MHRQTLPIRHPEHLEEAALNAWPALATLWLDGAVVRLSRGFTRRANSATQLHPGHLPDADRVARVAALYRGEGLRPIFRLRDLDPCPDHPDNRLDALLADAGWSREATTRVLVAALDDPRLLGEGPPPAVADAALGSWLATYGRLTNLPEQAQQLHGLLLKGIPLPRLFAHLPGADGSAACLLAVLDGPLLGVFDLVTDPARRRQGLATRLLRGALAWGRERGARTCWLQVEAANQPAQALYTALGFQPVYSYWYRVAPLSDGPADKPQDAHKPVQ